MNLIIRYREAFTFYVFAAVVLTAVAVGTDGNAQDGAPPLPRPSSTPTETPTFTSTPTPTASALPTAPPVTLPPSSPPPSIIIAAPTPTMIPTSTPTPTPSPTATPRNKAKGLKDGCLVQKKKWLLKVPCPQAHMIPEET